jgi:hypothetical protein
MPYTDAMANASNSSFTTLCDTIELITSGGIVLGTVPVVYGTPAVSGDNSVSTIASTPISFTWSGTGTVGGFRYKDGSTQLGEFIGSWAVSVTGGGGIVQISSLSATNGGDAQLTSGTHSFPRKVQGEP